MCGHGTEKLAGNELSFDTCWCKGIFLSKNGYEISASRTLKCEKQPHAGLLNPNMHTGSLLIAFLSVFVITVSFALYAEAELGVDMSTQECSGMTQSDWNCLVSNGFTFAIVQAFQGGNGLGPDTARSDKWGPEEGGNLTSFSTFE